MPADQVLDPAPGGPERDRERQRGQGHGQARIAASWLSPRVTAA
jgi:hypothetical protein